MAVCWLTFSSRALWCSKSDLRALRTSTSLDTPAGDDACRFTTVILSERSCRDTKHSRCSNSSWNKGISEHSSCGVNRQNRSSNKGISEQSSCGVNRQNRLKHKRKHRCTSDIDTSEIQVIINSENSRNNISHARCSYNWGTGMHQHLRHTRCPSKNWNTGTH